MKHRYTESGDAFELGNVVLITKNLLLTMVKEGEQR